MSREDDLVNALVRMERKQSLYDRVEVEPEAHYNDYGTRGVADLHVRCVEQQNQTIFDDSVYEVKSESAVRQATGANEIIRQFNRMRKHFYNDDRREHPSNVRFELCFEITPYTVQHVAENIEMYSAARRSKLYEHHGEYDRETIMFRHPNGESIAPAALRGLVNFAPRDVRDWARKLSASTRGGRMDNAMTDVLNILDDLYDHGLDPAR